jgi:metal-responsive CopG/Arc/MetJ family transcriptional regulator
MKTALSLPDDLFESAERLAQRLGLSRSQLYQQAIRIYLEQHDEANITEALNQVYAREGTARLDPLLDRMQKSVLDEESW